MFISKIQKIALPSLEKFNIQIKHTEISRTDHINGIELHSHKELEIYVNLSGNISFLVGNTIYPLTKGDIIVARPGEMHHCIYNSDEVHKLYWILINCEKNKTLFDYLLNKSFSNYISPKKEDRIKIIDLCQNLIDENTDLHNKLFSFFNILILLEENDTKHNHALSSSSYELSKILDYIDEHICENINLDILEKELFISKSTIERKFKKHIQMNPIEFIRKRKLIMAASLLEKGCTVLEAGSQVGYSDNSYFIKIFKQYFGMTPFKYKENLRKKHLE